MCLKLGRLKIDSPGSVIMGILNVTPDSFSDGGMFIDPAAALAKAIALRAEGAAIIDIGPESTRPGSDPVQPDEQLRRCLPVIEGLRSSETDVVISIDTTSAVVAEEAIKAGANLINDVSALRDDPEMVAVARKSGVPVILMHRRGMSSNMQAGGGPRYDNVVNAIMTFLTERIQFALAEGVERDRILVDPGIGFGKRVDDNLKILRSLDQFRQLGYPLVVGASRKRFIGTLLGERDPVAGRSANERLAGSLACALIAAQQKTDVLRVHDVKATADALRMMRAITDPDPDGETEPSVTSQSAPDD